MTATRTKSESSRVKTILVTGATSTVGREIVKQLLINTRNISALKREVVQ